MDRAELGNSMNVAFALLGFEKSAATSAKPELIAKREFKVCIPKELQTLLSAATTECKLLVDQQ